MAIADERVVGGQRLALEVVEAGGGEVARLQRRGERVEVVQPGPGRVHVDRALLHPGELRLGRS